MNTIAARAPIALSTRTDAFRSPTTSLARNADASRERLSAGDLLFPVALVGFGGIGIGLAQGGFGLAAAKVVSFGSTGRPPTTAVKAAMVLIPAAGQAALVAFTLACHDASYPVGMPRGAPIWPTDEEEQVRELRRHRLGRFAVSAATFANGAVIGALACVVVQQAGIRDDAHLAGIYLGLGVGITWLTGAAAYVGLAFWQQAFPWH